MTKSSHAGQDLVGSLRPHERFGRRIAEGDVGENGRLEGARASMGPPLDLFVGEQGEPAFDEIEPGPTGRGEVEMEARPAGQPAMNHGRFVRAIVVENQVHIQLAGHGGVNSVQEFAELDGSMPAMQLTDYL